MHAPAVSHVPPSGQFDAGVSPAPQDGAAEMLQVVVLFVCGSTTLLLHA
jgi:hypothetical protein